MHEILRLQDGTLLIDVFHFTLSGWMEELGKSDRGRGKEERI